MPIGAPKVYSVLRSTVARECSAAAMLEGRSNADPKEVGEQPRPPQEPRPFALSLSRSPKAAKAARGAEEERMELQQEVFNDMVGLDIQVCSLRPPHPTPHVVPDS